MTRGDQDVRTAAGARAYLDVNASAPLFPEVARALTEAHGLANPSSIHAEGRRARAALEGARAAVAALVGAAAGDLVFTSGGTEACNAALRGLGDGGPRPDVLFLTGAEHPCVLEGHGFPPGRVRRLALDEHGRLDLGALHRAVAEAAGARILLALQAANSETGVLQPVRAAAEVVHAAGGLVFSDAVQALGKVPVDLGALGADAIAVSAHKIGGPKGVGALVFALGRRLETTVARGGGQERGQRAGTENVAGIIGFGVAAETAAARLPDMNALRARRETLERAMLAIWPDLYIFGAGAPRLPNTICFAIPDRRAETALIVFDLAGVALSSGSACSSGKVRRSLVLDSMGVDPALAECALRLSMGWDTIDAEIERFLHTLAVFCGAAAGGRRAAAA